MRVEGEGRLNWGIRVPDGPEGKEENRFARKTVVPLPETEEWHVCAVNARGAHPSRR